MILFFCDRNQGLSAEKWFILLPMFDLDQAANAAAKAAIAAFPKEKAVDIAVKMLQNPGTSDPDKKRLLVALGILTGQTFIGPQEILLDIIGTCNLNCIYCRDHSPLVHDRASWRDMEMPYELIVRMIDEGVELGASKIALLGAGEPPMHSRFEDILKRIKKAPVHFETFTNGLSLTPDLLDLFLDANRGHLYFSICAASEKTYKHFRPGLAGKPLAAIEKNIEYLTRRRDDGLKITVVHVLNNVNFHEVIPMMEHAIDLGVDEVQYKLTEYADFSHALKMTPEQLHSVKLELRHVRLLAARAGVDIQDNIEFQLEQVNPDTGNYAERLADDLGCHIGWEFLRIRRDGEISFCCGLKFLENIHNTTLADYWYGPRLQEARLAARGFPAGKNLEINKGQMLKDRECDYCYNYIFNLHSRNELDRIGLLPILEKIR